MQIKCCSLPTLPGHLVPWACKLTSHVRRGRQGNSTKRRCMIWLSDSMNVSLSSSTILADAFNGRPKDHFDKNDSIPTGANAPCTHTRGSH